MNPLDSILAELAALREKVEEQRTTLRLGTFTAGGVVRDGETEPVADVVIPSGNRVLTASHNRRTFILGQGFVPVGGIVMWAAATAPVAGAWGICDGSAFDTEEYPELASLLGGSTLPDLRDRFPRGASGSAAVRSTGGSETISTAQMPSHTHSVPTEDFTLADGIDYTVTGLTSGGAAVASGSAGTGAAYWPKFYAVNYVIRMA